MILLLVHVLPNASHNIWFQLFKAHCSLGNPLLSSVVALATLIVVGFVF